MRLGTLRPGFAAVRYLLVTGEIPTSCFFARKIPVSKFTRRGGDAAELYNFVRVGYEHRSGWRMLRPTARLARERNLLNVRSLHASLPRTMRRAVVFRVTPVIALNFEIVLRNNVKFPNTKPCRTAAFNPTRSV